MTTLPLPEESTQLDDPLATAVPDLRLSPGLSVEPDLTVMPYLVEAAVTDDYLRTERAASDAAMLEGVTRAAAGVEVLVGAWLAISPWLVGSNDSQSLRWSNIVVGLLLIALGALRLTRPATPRGPAVSFGLGAWTIIAAFVLSFQNGATGTAPLWSAIACGAVLTGAAAWATTEAERAGLHGL